MKWIVEATDTFGGEANYSWCHRYAIETPNDASDRTLARTFKATAGVTGDRGRSAWIGETWEFRPYGACVVVFATPNY
jgi:hypothetical protein